MNQIAISITKKTYKRESLFLIGMITFAVLVYLSSLLSIGIMLANERVISSEIKNTKSELVTAEALYISKGDKITKKIAEDFGLAVIANGTYANPISVAKN